MSISKGFRETRGVDFVVHFHGWQNIVAGTLQVWKNMEQLVASEHRHFGAGAHAISKVVVLHPNPGHDEV